MEMPKPTEAHKKLEMLVGSWSGEEKLQPSPWDPQGGTAVGTVENRAALGGFAVVQDYRQERGGRVTFEGHGVFRYEPMAGVYEMWWFDSMGMPPTCFRGGFEGNVLMVAAQGPQGWSRAVFDFGKKGSYTFRMEVSPDGAQWFGFMEGRYARTE